jgi:hypothetical protein
MSRGGKKPAPAPVTTDDPLGRLTADLAEIGGKLVDVLGKAVKTFDVVTLLTRPIGEILDNVATLTISAVELGGMVVHKLLEWTERFIKMIKEAMNAPIEVPFLSAFYQQHVGNDMTALSASVLLIAVPVTLIYKACTGKAPVERVAVAAAPQMFATDSQARRAFGYQVGGVAAAGAVGSVVALIRYLSTACASFLSRTADQLSALAGAQWVKSITLGLSVGKVGATFYSILDEKAPTSIRVVRGVRVVTQSLGIIPAYLSRVVAGAAPGTVLPNQLVGLGQLKAAAKCIDCIPVVVLGGLAAYYHFKEDAPVAAAADLTLTALFVADTIGTVLDAAGEKAWSAGLMYGSLALSTPLTVVPLASEWVTLPELIW